MPSREIIDGVTDYAKSLDGVDAQALREGMLMVYLHRRLESALEQDLSRWGLSARQIDIMEAVYFRGDAVLTPAELAESVGLTRSAMTSALDTLESREFTIRSMHPSDRRKVVISLTPTGREYLESHLPERYERLAGLGRILAAEERAEVIQAYKKVLASLTDEKLDELMRGNGQRKV